MKDEQIHLQVSPEEKSLLKKAARNLNFETGAKENISEAIRHSVKKYAETDLTKPECFFIDRQSIRQTESNVNFGLIYLQKFLDEFKEITGTICKRDELETMFSGLFKLGSAAIIQDAISEMVKQKLYQRLVKAHPDMIVSFDNVPEKDMTVLFEIANKLSDIPTIKMRPVFYWHVYTINGSVVSVLQNELESLKDNFRFYATSPLELQKLQKVKALCEVLNSFLADPEIIPEKIFTLVYFDKEAAKFAPSGAYIKFNLQPQILFERYSK